MSKESDLKQSSEGGGGYGSYGGYGGYGGYSAGYGYGEEGGGAGGIQRTLKDYLLILRERIWYVVVVFLVVFSSFLVYTLTETKIYQSTATVHILRSGPTVVQKQEVVDTDIRSGEDFNTQIKILESFAMAQAVAERIVGEDRRDFLAPFEGMDASGIAGTVYGNRSIGQQRNTLVVQISFRHPDRFVAAKVANFYVDEYLAYSTAQRMKETQEAVKQLEAPLAEQKAKVDALNRELYDLKEKGKTVSLDANRDVVGASLQNANSRLQEATYQLSDSEFKINKVREYKEKNAELTELPFIAGQSVVSGLLEKVTGKRIEKNVAAERFLPKHPEMLKIDQALTQSETELKAAIEKVCMQLEVEYQTALQKFNNTQAELEKKKAESLELDKINLEYSKKESELKVQESNMNNIMARQTDVITMGSISTQNARSMDKAMPAGAGNPISPRVGLNLGVGVLCGLGLGLVFAFFVAFIDDRVKSSFDIEGVVGLPLIGIIPQIKRMEQSDKAQIVLNNADRQVAEAFLTLHSSLRLKDESKNAKVILTTSTIPGEGKSFTTTNLALTFAAHGERVAIVDCDLRKPNIHKSFRLENLKGVIDVCAGKMTIDEVVIKGPHANLDIIPAGGRAKNPTQILNSKGFELMISDLRKKYDRVFVDTPPLAAVSDALIILPLVDGSIFTIYFNKVRRKAAQFAAKRLTEANVPNFGAVLNGLNLAVSGYYYAQYYDKSYKDYYVVMAKEDETSKER